MASSVRAIVLAVADPLRSAPIPFNRPSVASNELAFVHDAIGRGHISGNGYYTARCEAVLAQLVGGGTVALTTSCTHALEMAALLLDLGPGDEVIVPSFTFVSTANAFALRGARPVFVDVRADTLNLDERLVEGAVTARTRAIVVMHYGGVACEMEAIAAIASRAGAVLLEDNAHGLFGAYRGRPLGSFGAAAALSFHESKNITCGEGGALVLNDASFVERALVLRDKGTNRTQFLRGEVDRYQWLDLGSSYVMSEMLAGFLYGQLDARAAIQQRRAEMWRRYQTELAGWAARRGVALPAVPPECEPSYHLFHLVLPSPDERPRFLAHLEAAGVQAAFHYQPLHVSPMGQRLGGRAGQCPVTESASARLVRLPLFHKLTPEEQDRIVEAVCRF